MSSGLSETRMGTRVIRLTYRRRRMKIQTKTVKKGREFG